MTQGLPSFNIHFQHECIEHTFLLFQLIKLLGVGRHIHPHTHTPTHTHTHTHTHQTTRTFKPWMIERKYMKPYECWVTCTDTRSTHTIITHTHPHRHTKPQGALAGIQPSLHDPPHHWSLQSQHSYSPRSTIKKMMNQPLQRRRPPPISFLLLVVVKDN